MTDVEYRALQQGKFYSNHKQYKVYLTTDTDEELIKAIENSDNKSAFIRRAIISYLRGKEK